MFSELYTKLNKAKEYCITKNNSEPRPIKYTVQEWKQILTASAKAYTGAFSDIVSSIEKYKSGGNEFDAIWSIMSAINCRMMVTEDNPPSMWKVYNMDGVSDEILEKNISSFYEGVMIDGGVPGYLNNLNERINKSSENAKWSREHFAMECSTPLTSQIPKVMFSEYKIPMISRSKLEAADFVYRQAHAAEIIRDYEIDMFIPEGF